MNRVLAFVIFACLVVCAVTATRASDLTFVKPAATVNFDGDRHLNISHNRQQQEQKKQDSCDSADSLTFDKKSDSSDSFPIVPVCVVAGLVAVGAGVAVQWNQIAKGVSAVHA
jgi:hypothetical protein